MINPISFTSTYKAYITKTDTQQGKYSHPELTDYLDKNNIRYSQTFIDPKITPAYSNPFKTDESSQYVPEINDYAVSKYTIAAPDSFDNDIETIMANRGIKFEKIATDDVTAPLSILNRLASPQKGYYLAAIDSKKLEQLVQKQDSNFDHCKNDYENYFRENTDFLIKSDEEITPQTISIKYLADDSTPESLKRFVDRFGVKNLNEGSIAIYQAQRGDRTDVNLYYALKKLGFSKVPVYLDKESYENAKTLGLL